MLHTNFQGHRPFSPEKKIFKGFLPYMDMVAIFSSYPDLTKKHSFPHPTEAPNVMFGFSQLSTFRREEVKNTEPEASRTKVSK